MSLFLYKTDMFAIASFVIIVSTRLGSDFLFTISFSEKNRQPLYEQLYKRIKQNIVEGILPQGKKLPSKRKLAEHLQISKNTVENAYAQLIAEGYVETVEKKGYFVRQIDSIIKKSKSISDLLVEERDNNDTYIYDLKTNAVDLYNFPFATWAKLMREILRDENDSLLKPIHPQGDLSLRKEIARYLKEYKNMSVHPEQIILGAGSEYLFSLIIELLPNSVFAVENPCYHKIVRILQSRDIKFHPISMDAEGMRKDELEKTDSSIAFITPSRHFPLGTVMSINRRMQMLKWADTDNFFIIEDDYDSEYRYALKPIPTLHSLDNDDKVIYLNTFTRTLAPSLRIGYMVLPPDLLETYRKKLTFYSCTVSEFEQRTLKKFLEKNYYERHLNRMRTIYKNRRDIFIRYLGSLANVLTIKGYEAGLHLLITSNKMSEIELIQKAKENGVKVYGLSEYYLDQTPETNTVIVGYGGLATADVSEVAELLIKSWQ
ncbi:PLP-dependent aminotransferase family protein [Selenomonadales bacterium OttesenSCG-928-I06]|nr:PLP-dependent aminotransferase family protein [Selenomonadales bacterium OttesenSCG-928-I06]